MGAVIARPLARFVLLALVHSGRGAVLEVTAGSAPDGEANEPTLLFTFDAAAHRLVVDQDGWVNASEGVRLKADDVVTSGGSSLAEMDQRLSAALDTIDALNATLQEVLETVQRQATMIELLGKPLTPPPAIPPPPPPPHMSVTTLAGTGSIGTDDGVGSEATFSYPTDICYTHDYTGLFIGDRNNNRLRRMDVNYPYTVSTVATNLPYIWGVAASPDGQYVYAATISGNIRGTGGKIVKITISTGAQETLVSGLSQHRGMVITSDGSKLYIADEFPDGYGGVRWVTTSDGANGRLASGTPSSGCGTPNDMTLSADQSTVYAACGNEQGVYAYTISNGNLRSYIRFNVWPGNVHGAALSSDGNTMYVTDWGDCEIFAVVMNGLDLTTSKTSIVGQVNYDGGSACGFNGDGHIGNSAKVGRVVNTLVSQDGKTLYFTDSNRVRSVAL